MSIEQPTLGRVLRVYAFAQALAILIPVLVALSGVDLGSSTNLIGSFVSAMVAGQAFVKSFGRAPTREERWRLAWLSLATAWGISLLFVGLLIVVAGQEAIDMFKPLWQVLPSAVLMILVVVICALYLGVFQLAYGPMARSFEKKLAVKRP
jgi:hypothetical protein